MRGRLRAISVIATRGATKDMIEATAAIMPVTTSAEKKTLS
jgi:hypothetical protein